MINKSLTNKNEPFKCPDCGHPQYCPCPVCAYRTPEGMKPWVWQEDGERVACKS